jgi:serine/threonine-protein kinase
MGTVYLAEHGPSQRRVALKIIRPELESSAIARNRFLRECESLERIESPHVVEVLESGAAPGGEIYLGMERLEGVPLGERTDEGALPLGEVVRVGVQVAAALTAAHAAGIVHRDLKPDNVFLCDSGVVKVLDFGIARLLDGRTLEGASNKLTATGTIVGTPAYMSPEGAAGAAVGPAGDLYSFGVMLYEMVSGQLPFWAEQPVLVLGKHLKEPAPPASPASPSA